MKFVNRKRFVARGGWVRWAHGLGVAVLVLCAPLCVRGGTNLSAWAFPASSGRLLRQPDPLGNRVLDYSDVGYKGGTGPLPEVPVKVTVAPVAGDNGANIQNAINYVKALPLDTNGFRGAVLLAAGEYPISNSITINASGIVLRGAGDGTNGTVLRAAGAGQRTLVSITGSGSASTVSGTTHTVTNAYVSVGARSFNVDSTSGLSVGDRVFVRRIATTNWIHDLGMDLLCCPPDVNPWEPSGYHIDFDRLITRIEGNRIMVDAPLTCAIDQYYGGGTIRKFTWSGRITNVGIESIRGVSDFDPSITSTTGASSSYYADENHGWVFVKFSAVENGWARRLTSQSFGYACVQLSGSCRSVTVRDCQSLDPVSIITGSRRYAFVLDDSQLCLVQNCYTRKDRHQFVTQSLTTGPNVFVDGLSDTAYSDAGPHHRWGTGALWDSVTVNGNNLNVQNRGNLGSGHGWAGANEVVWNCDADGGFVVQNPPTAHNWLIGSLGAIQNGTVYVGPHDPGTYDSPGTTVFPSSLYYAQLQDRLAAPNLQTREYWVGEIDQFQAGSPAGEVVPVDAAWRSAVQAAAGSASVSGFDLVAANQWVPWTFTFSLAPAERIVGATVAMALRTTSPVSTNETLYLDSTTGGYRFADLGWLPLGTGTNTTVRVLDLGGQLGLLADGKLNLAVSDDVGVDWALLELQVAPGLTAYTNVLWPSADAFVRGGSSAALNYGTNTTLDVKADSQAANQRVGYLRWNLAGYSAPVLQARLRLTPVSVGTNGLEQGVTLAPSDNWNENTLTWNNQPGGSKRFATWIPTANVPVEVAVTPQVQEALAGDGWLSLELLPLKNVGAPGLVSYASSEDPDPLRRPQLLLVTTNPVPSISQLKDRNLPPNTNTGPLSFTVGDPVYAASVLTVEALSSDTNLVPRSGLSLGGALSNRTLTVTPALGRTGSALITITVSDPAGMRAGASFTLAVTNGSTTAPASGSWSVDASGDWSNPANWSGGLVATGADMTATFALDLTASRYVNNDSPRTLGHLSFGDANTNTAGQWTLTNQPLTLQVSSGTALLAVEEGNATIATALDGTQGLAKQGEGTLALSGSNTFSGAVSINAGALQVANGNALGGSADATTINNSESARLELAGNISLAEPLTVACKAAAAGNVPAVVNLSGTNTLAGALTLTTGGSFWTFEAAGGKLIVSGKVTNSTTTNVRTLWLRGAAEGDWRSAIANSAAALGTSIRKDDAGVWTLSATNTYTGNTVVSNGTLVVNGVVGAGGSVLVYGGTLGGNGSILSPVTLSDGASLDPGPGLGTLCLSNTLTLSAGSTTRVEVSGQTLAHDLVQGLTSVTYAGALVVSNVAGTLAPGQSFQLFSAASSSGAFSSISPAFPGPGLAWSFNPGNGTLSVLSLPSPQITQFGLGPGQSFVFSGTGPTNQRYRILAATNAALPLSNWSAVSSGAFMGGVFNFTDDQASNYAQRFFRVATP